MRKLSRLGCLSLLILGLCAALLGTLPAAPRLYAAVTLLSFTATTQDGIPTVYLRWETATERDTASFYVQRSSSSAGPYVVLGDLISAVGDAFSGTTYPVDGPLVDMTTELNHTYYYQLIEVQTNQTTQQVGDTLAVTAGVSQTPTPTATATATTLPGNGQVTSTSTRTPTPTPTPTATSKIVLPAGRSPITTIGTPSILNGMTITPMPINTRPSTSIQPTTPQPNSTPDAGQPSSNSFAPTPPAAVMVNNDETAASASSAQIASDQSAPNAVPTQLPAGAVNQTALVDPVVIAPTAPPVDSAVVQPSASLIVLLLLAAISLLVGGLLITRHSRR